LFKTGWLDMDARIHEFADADGEMDFSFAQFKHLTPAHHGRQIPQSEPEEVGAKASQGESQLAGKATSGTQEVAVVEWNTAPGAACITGSR
jgi:hypothetical protein